MSNTPKGKDDVVPILYTFRRCPYAMRARLAIEISGVTVEYREILLRDKPQTMLEASPKGTVPVLVINNKVIIDESMNVMYWALQQSDPDNYLDSNLRDEAKKLIELNDSEFKSKLDCYKYAVRFPGKSEVEYRDECLEHLHKLNNLLMKNEYLLGDKPTIADIAIFPFIRQFASVDRSWFDSIEYKYLQNWLNYHLESKLFKHIMIKREIWLS